MMFAASSTARELIALCRLFRVLNFVASPLGNGLSLLLFVVAFVAVHLVDETLRSFNGECRT